MADAKKSQSVTIETGPVVCGRCGLHMSPLVIEEIEGVAQLRAGKALINKIEACCLTPKCGWMFYWNIREKDLEKNAVLYGEILRTIRPGYVPE